MTNEQKADRLAKLALSCRGAVALAELSPTAKAEMWQNIEALDAGVKALNEAKDAD